MAAAKPAAQLQNRMRQILLPNVSAKPATRGCSPHTYLKIKHGSACALCSCSLPDSPVQKLPSTMHGAMTRKIQGHVATQSEVAFELADHNSCE